MGFYTTCFTYLSTPKTNARNQRVSCHSSHDHSRYDHSYNDVIDSLVTHAQIYVDQSEVLIQQMLAEGVTPTRMEYQVSYHFDKVKF